MRTHIQARHEAYVCPHTAVCILMLLYVSSYCCVCVLILLCMRPHTAVCVLMCPHTTICVFSYYYIGVLILIYMCPHTATCVLILLYMCPHTTTHMSHQSAPRAARDDFSGKACSSRYARLGLCAPDKHTQVQGIRHKALRKA